MSVRAAKAAIEGPANDRNLQDNTVAELAGWAARELMSIYFQGGKHLVGTPMGSPEGLAVEHTLANIRFVLPRRRRMPR